MPVEWQWVCVTAGVAWAAFFVVRRVWLALRPGVQEPAGCGGCGGCTKDGAPPLVELKTQPIESLRAK